MEALNLFGQTLDELRSLLQERGMPRYRAEQVFYWMYNRRVTDFGLMTNLPKAERTALAESFRITHPVIAGEQNSADGTRKFLFTLEDDLRVETVLIPSETEEAGRPKRLTLCLSTQVGCPLDCAFCATASMKMRRNARAGEIVGQYFGALAASGQRITNLVYMGMGEPMLNYDETMKSIDLITHETTCGVGSAHITVSTAGLVDGIRRMADEQRKAKLAISLHSTDDALRSVLMPINRKYPLSELIAAAEYYYRATRRRITWEYILFDGLNDTEADVQRLLRLMRRVPSKVNLIPFHPIDSALSHPPRLELRPTPPARIEQFAEALRAGNATVMLRSSSGRDIDAACGQLAVRSQIRKRPAVTA